MSYLMPDRRLAERENQEIHQGQKIHHEHKKCQIKRLNHGERGEKQIEQKPIWPCLPSKLFSMFSALLRVLRVNALFFLLLFSCPSLFFVFFVSTSLDLQYSS
jgi:hypothetical protein